MLFFSKRTNAPRQSSNVEACVSILGLILVVGLIGGLSALIYGLVKQILLSIIAGAVVLGVSAFFSVILALVFAFCLKNNDVNSNTNEHRSTGDRRQYAQHRRQQPNHSKNHTKIPSHEISVVSGAHRMDPNQQKQSTVHNTSMTSTPIYNGLGDSTNYGYGKQMPQSPSKISPFAFPNQPNGPISNNNYNSHVKRNDYNRH